MNQDISPLFSSRLCILGILNVTPDSFSDGGLFSSKNNAIDHAISMVEQGAHIIDIGGESTRPGAQVVDIKEEISRVVPIIEALVKEGIQNISIDTRNAETMRAALDAGANIINDVSALTHDPESINVALSSSVPLILMHMQGTPKNMQKEPSYRNVVCDLYQYFERLQIKYETLGIKMNRIVIDPGIGFGKNLEHNLLTIRNISEFIDLGFPVMLGTSRKSFIGKISDEASIDDRLGGSVSSVIWGYLHGVNIFRVHDVKETVQALKVWDAISNAS